MLHLPLETANAARASPRAHASMSGVDDVEELAPKEYAAAHPEDGRNVAQLLSGLLECVSLAAAVLCNVQVGQVAY